MLVESISWGSWQNEQGLRIADVILALNGGKVDTVDDLLSLYEAIVSGASFQMTVFRGQNRVTLQGTK